MKYTDLIFDLYGTLVDIHTDENDEVWEKTAIFFGFYGACYTGQQLQRAFRAELASREAQAGQAYECYPDIPIEQIMARLFACKHVADAQALGLQAAQLFRISSMAYIRLYPHVRQALSELRAQGFRLWLLSNAQRVFTAYELRHLGLEQAFDGICLSSDYGCRKPDRRFYRALLQAHHLEADKCLMIGNDRSTDIAGAQAVGMATLYMHTNLTPADQPAADPRRHPGQPTADGCWEYEGSDWQALVPILQALCQ